MIKVRYEEFGKAVDKTGAWTVQKEFADLKEAEKFVKKLEKEPQMYKNIEVIGKK